ncbi:restriction endonuclease subunit S [Salmonella enterica]|uniref:Restriction endonuclease subunit S n=1 Tax=Salmonella enterica TaxID=28901 RepID=A0A5U1R4I8_SALER|nr:restriction endonuclease subunit S [Salmonella enterica]EDI3199110.1 restriction endonuclease subunit S [Salmonella enterica subsp. enterica serovar Rubislaw]EDQ3986464.1 restriction endonuclease subunit S [Salmonella enterica subsp. enterica serovar Abaetetuba]EDU7667620.1 restriction endonuclease subunit S [Salmonella enterica subsp. enterica serovar Glostrup]EDV5252781.1 restriction endonuclease subunit S [Salmonella enterica subsp. enterica]EED3672236.1 restriction endonuclease subunit 
MSELSYLEKLLDGVEVEWKAVGDIAGYSTTKVDADKLDATSFVGVDNLLADKGGRIDATYQPNTARLTAYEPGDILLGNIRPYLKKVWMAENNGGCSGDVLAIRILADCKKIISPEYLYYALSSDSFFSYSMQHAKGAKMPRGSKDAILNYQIPIPCPSAPGKSLAIQSEIVRILDKFTALTAELTAELTMRKKQYNYYRDQLLRFNTEDVPHLPMGQKDIGEFIRGGTFQKKDFMDAGVGCIHYGQIYTYYGTYTKKTKTHISATLAKKCKKAQKGNLIIATTSENDEDVCKAVAWLGSEDIAVSSDACIYKHNLNPKYVSYFFQTEQFQNQKRQYITGAKVRRVNADNLSKILIPVPSMKEQERIVSILDKFDTLTNSITEGLPREIELRQKQYEYYRDLLFNFPKPETVSN